jgi:protein-tyrosine phosphatase
MVEYKNISLIEPNILLGGISPDNETKSFYKESNMAKIVDKYKIDVVISVYDFLPEKRTKTKAKRFLLVIHDHPDSKLSKYFEKIAFIIHEAKKKKKRVFIHCHMGISRSVSLLIAYYLKYKRTKVQNTIKFLRERRPYINPNLGFLKQLYDFESQLAKNDTNFQK